MSAPRTRAALLLAVLALLAAPGARDAAAEPAGDASRLAPVALPELVRLVGRLGSPADPLIAKQLAPLARSSDPARAKAIVGALWHAGGHASASGLLEIGARSKGDLRVLAWECFARLELRVGSPTAVRSVREAMSDPDPTVRRQAFAAIGILGTSEDFPALLEAAASPDGTVRTFAWSALRALTGLTIQPQVRRWSDWWVEAEADLKARVATALDDLELGEDPSRVQLARQVLARSAWVDLPAVEEAVRDWLAFGDVRLRAEGYRVVAALRWGDLATALDRALVYERDPEALEEGRRAGRLVGLPVPPAPPTAPTPHFGVLPSGAPSAPGRGPSVPAEDDGADDGSAEDDDAADVPGR